MRGEIVGEERLSTVAKHHLRVRALRVSSVPMTRLAGPRLYQSYLLQRLDHLITRNPVVLRSQLDTAHISLPRVLDRDDEHILVPRVLVGERLT